jgi:hypothetical protein
MGWPSRQAVALFRTSCEVLDASAFLSHPTAPHLAAFYLAIARSAVCASPVPHNSSLSCDLTRTRRALRQQFPCRLIAAAMSTLWRAARASCSPNGPKPGRRSCIGCARCLLIERRKTASRRSRSGTHPGITCAEWSASQTAMAHGTAATTITSTSIPGCQKSVVRQARAGGFAGSTHSFQTEL